MGVQLSEKFRQTGSRKTWCSSNCPIPETLADSKGGFYFNNVRVNGIIPENKNDLFFILGVLNSPIANWVFTKIAKPKDNGYYESNKQFIAPLPIPDATDSQKKSVTELAEHLQKKHTARRNEIEKLQTRLDSPNCLDVNYEEDWLWADVKTVAEIEKQAPDEITGTRKRTAWAKKERERRLSEHYEKLDSHLRAGMKLTASSVEDALSIESGDLTLLTRYGLPADEAAFLASIWRQILRGINITAKYSGEKLVKKLLNFRSTDDADFRQTILALDAKVQTLDAEIATAEAKINKLIYQLYNLSDEEIELVESV